MKSVTISFFLTVIALFIFLISPTLFSDGMFMDGLLYATASKNLAHGLATFWHPHISETFGAAFYQHPPLMFFLQSLFFKVLGDGFLTERIYSLLTYVFSGGLVVLIWRQLTIKRYYSLSWLPILLWTVIPLTIWCVSNNMIENTMMVFTLLAILFMLKSLAGNRFIYLFAAGVILFLGFLCKGFTGLYPFSTLFWIWLVKKEVSLLKFVTGTAISLVGFLVPVLIVYLFMDGGVKWFTAYMDQQLVRSLTEVRTVDNRFWIIIRLFKELVPSFAIVFTLFVIGKFNKKKINVLEQERRWAICISSIALSGVVPIMVSAKQSGFYISSTFPLFGIAFALLIAPVVSLGVSKMHSNLLGTKLFIRISRLLFLAAMIFAFYQTKQIGRDKEMLHDIRMVSSIVIEEDNIISISPNLTEHYNLRGYFSRYAGISLDAKNVKRKYLLVNRGKENTNKDGYSVLPLGLKMYDLYKRNTP